MEDHVFEQIRMFGSCKRYAFEVITVQSKKRLGNNLLKQRLWQISFQYDFDKLFSLLYQVFKSTLSGSNNEYHYRLKPTIVMQEARYIRAT